MNPGQGTLGEKTVTPLGRLLGTTFPPAPLARLHTGSRASVEELLSRLVKETEDPGLKHQGMELLWHLQVVAHRYYMGDVEVVDEMLQLYGLDRDRPAR